MTTCADSIDTNVPNFQLGDGGEIPASALHFQVGHKDDANDLVVEFHYSHRPRNVTFVGSFHDDMGKMLAAAIFSTPPTRWSEDVLELSRLVRRDGLRLPLTRLISLSCKHLKQSGYDLLISFADSTQGHHGGIYQACSWNYHCQRKRSMDGLMVDGVFVPGRTCNARWGTRSPEKLKSQHPELTIEAHFDDGKHLYWRALSKSGDAKAARLGLQKLKYPKPELGV